MTRQQSTNQAPASFHYSASKKLKLAARALMATLDKNIQIPGKNGEMQCVPALIDCGATSIHMTPRLQVTRDITSGGTNHHPCHDQRCDATCKGHRKTWITVYYLDYLTPVDKVDMLVMLMHSYDSARGLLWFHKQNLVIDWARLTPYDHRERVERRK